MIAAVFVLIGYAICFLLSMLFKTLASLFEILKEAIAWCPWLFYVLAILYMLFMAFLEKKVLGFIATFGVGVALYFFLMYPFAFLVGLLVLLVEGLENLSNIFAKLPDKGFKKILESILRKTEEN